MRISCLHTNAENISYFEAAAPAGVTLTHFLRPELCLRAGTPGTAEGLGAEVGAQLQKMRDGADAVLTASTALAPHAAPPAWSADALLIQALTERGAGRRVEVFHANPLAEVAVTALYGAIPGTASLSITRLPDAWEAACHGDLAAHARQLRDAIDRSDAELIALVQPAMAQAAGQDPRVLSAVHVALQRLAAGRTRVTRQHEPVG
jgi:hypothetical protein